MRGAKEGMGSEEWKKDEKRREEGEGSEERDALKGMSCVVWWVGWMRT